jgi:hypothetical protein
VFLEFGVAGLAPVTLVVLAGMYVRAWRADGKIARRWLLFLLSASVLLIAPQSLLYRWELYNLQAHLQPAVFGTLAALFIHLSATPELWSGATLWITLPGVLAIAALLGHLTVKMDRSVIAMVLISAIAAFVWQAWEWRGKRRWLAYLALLFLLLMVCGWMLGSHRLLMNGPEGLYGSVFIGSLLVWPVVAVVLVARLVHTSIAAGQPSSWPATMIRLALAVFLLLVIGDLIVMETVWVQAEDSLSVIPVVVFTAAVASAMLLAWAVTGWCRLGALVLALLVMLTASSAFERGFWTSPTELTEARAEKIARAIQRYYERQGHYPSRLANLVPLYLLHVPQPMIFRNQTWCYEGGDDYYRLGYVHQPAFGVPPEYIAIRLHAAVGEPPGSSWPCDEELESAKSKAPGQ